MPQDSALPIVLCADESYIKYASVVMISVLKATKARVRFYLVSDRVLPKATLTKLSCIESTYPNASISHSCHSLARFVSLPTQGENNSHITYLRLLLDSILPQSVSKCVYLDCDVLVCADIAGLFSYDLHGALLGAVRDLAFNDASSACRNHLGFYFNAGVLLLDMEKWRESKASRRLFHLIATRPQITQGFHDQNLLNECFCDEVCELPLGWNAIAAPPHTLRFTQEDSALGSHSADFGDFRATADHKSSSALKSPKNYESNTAIPRILEEDKQNALESSSRADEVGVAIHSPNTQNLESSMDCHDLPSKSRNDSNNAPTLNELAKDSRIVDEKSGLCESTQGRALGVRNRRVDEAIADLSLQAESTNQKLALLCRHSRATYDSALESPYIVHFAAQPKPWGRVCYIKQTHSTLELIEYANPHT
ncbi:glycosyltransferase family 8 protein, partial [Helicobacter canis]|uniref:glycosyltransferase family 8 protein n=1 Tax=Helicobacter canis TaxID=29419 RepID=UPI0026E9EC5D